MDIQASAKSVAVVLPKLKALVLKRAGLAIALWGEPGIGKTHAVQQMLRGLNCRSYSLHSTNPLSTWVRELPWPSNLNALPAWAEPLLDKLQAGEVLETKKTADVLAALLSSLAPVVLHLEDMHEAGPERLELIQRLAQTIVRTKGVGLLVTIRTIPPEGFEGYRLEPLSADDSRMLLEAEVGNNLPKEALEWIFAKAAGNPLFTLEYLRYLARQGIVWNDGRGWRWREPPGRTMPPTVEALIEQLLSEAAAREAPQQTLNALAMLGTESEPATWAAVAQLSEPQLQTAQADLEKLGVLQGQVFSHPMYREVLLQGLSPSVRRDLARRAIEALADTNLGAAVGFVDEAELEAEQSLAWYKRAAEQEQASGNPINAARMLAKAVPHAPEQERGRLALEVAQRLHTFDAQTAEGLAAEAVRLNPHDSKGIYFHARLLAHLRRGDEAIQTLARLPNGELESPQGLSERMAVHSFLNQHQQVLELWRAHPELEASAKPEVLRRVGDAAANLGDTDGAYALITKGLAHPNLQPQDRAALIEILGIICFYQSNYAEAERCFAEALTLYGSLGQAHRVSAIHFNRALALQKMGRYAEASYDIEQCANLAGQTGDIQSYTLSQSILGEQLFELGQYEQAEEAFQACRQTIERWPLSLNYVEAHGNLNDLYRDWGSSHSGVLALKHGHAALSYARRLANPRFLSEGLFYAAISEAKFGNPQKALELSLEQELLAHELKEPRQIYRAAWTKGAALVALGQGDEGLAELQRAYHIANEHGATLHSHKLGLEIAALTQDLNAAQEHLFWFAERGLMNGVNLAHRHFPSLAEGSSGVGVETKASGTQLEILGPLRVSGQAIRGGKRKELLAALLEASLSGRGETTTLDLLERLYPEVPELEGQALLRQVVFQVRQNLGQEAILTTAGGYALGAVGSDAEEFLRGGDTRLWRGTYRGDIEGEGDEGVWEALYRSLSDRGQTLLERDPSEAARVGRILLEADPYNLDHLTLTLKALRASNNHKTLARLYDQAKERFGEVGQTLPENWKTYLQAPVSA